MMRYYWNLPCDEITGPLHPLIVKETSKPKPQLNLQILLGRKCHFWSTDRENNGLWKKYELKLRILGNLSPRFWKDTWIEFPLVRMQTKCFKFSVATLSQKKSIRWKFPINIVVVSYILFVDLSFLLLFYFGIFNVNSKIDINTILEIITIFRYVKAVEGRTILKIFSGRW